MKKIILCAAIASLTAMSCSKQHEAIDDQASESNVMLPEPAPKEDAGDSTAMAGGVDAKGLPSANLTPDQQQGEKLIENMDCLTCHATDHKVVGPSYDDVAKKYTDADIDMLAKKIIDGGAGHWGDVAMSPHPGLAMDKAKLMVEYILSLKKS